MKYLSKLGYSGTLDVIIRDDSRFFTTKGTVFETRGKDLFLIGSYNAFDTLRKKWIREDTWQGIGPIYIGVMI